MVIGACGLPEKGCGPPVLLTGTRLRSSEVGMKARLEATNMLILHGLGFFSLCKTDNTLIKLHSCDLLSYFSRKCYVIAVWLTSPVHPCAPIWEELQVGKSEVFSGKTGLLEYLF